MLPITNNKNIIAVRSNEIATPERNRTMNTAANTTVTLTAAELDLLTYALRDRAASVCEVANGFDRAYGPADGRAKEAWQKAQRIQGEIAALAKKIGAKV
jgi:hypothetical protein